MDDMTTQRPAWATITDTTGVNGLGATVHAHYSAPNAEATLVRYDAPSPTGGEIGATQLMLWIGGDSLTTSHIDADQLRDLARDLATVAETIDEHLSTLADQLTGEG